MCGDLYFYLSFRSGARNLIHYLLKARSARNTHGLGASDYPSDHRPDSSAPRIRDARAATRTLRASHALALSSRQRHRSALPLSSYVGRSAFGRTAASANCPLFVHLPTHPLRHSLTPIWGCPFSIRLCVLWRVWTAANTPKHPASSPL